MQNNSEKESLMDTGYFKNYKILIFLIIGLMVNAFSWIYLLVTIKPQSDPIFLHYNIYFGVDLIGDWYRIYLLPLTGTIVYFINLYLSYIIYKKEKKISYLIIGLTIYFGILILIATLLIVRQNI